ncbi:MAG: c-type cytochrome [Burkholderiaceae bacterium]|jgi:cytochrome c553
MSVSKQTTFKAAVTGLAAAAGLAAMLASGSAMAQAPAVKGDAAAGAKKNSMCIGCHGIENYKTAFPVLYRVPKITGQHQAYFVAALQGYKSGERSHPSMQAIAGSLSDQDMADLAAFYAQGK